MTKRSPLDNPAPAEHAAEIRRLGKRAVEDVVEIGRRLTGFRASDLEHEFGPSISCCKVMGDEYPCRITPLAMLSGNVVYVLFDPRDGRPFYIGRTNKFIVRMREHCQVSRTRHPDAYGRGAHRIDLRKIEIYDAGLTVPCLPLQALSEDHADWFEQALIDALPDLLNRKINSLEPRERRHVFF